MCTTCAEDGVDVSSVFFDVRFSSFDATISHVQCQNDRKMTSQIDDWPAMRETAAFGSRTILNSESQGSFGWSRHRSKEAVRTALDMLSICTTALAFLLLGTCLGRMMHECQSKSCFHSEKDNKSTSPCLRFPSSEKGFLEFTPYLFTTCNTGLRHFQDALRSDKVD